MPRAAEGTQVVWEPCGYPDETERGDGFEEDVIYGVAGGGNGEGVPLDDADEEEGDEDPPGVGGELLLQVRLRHISR